MKKNLIRISASILALVCLVSLAACSGENTSSIETNSSSAAGSSSDAPASSGISSSDEDSSSAASSVDKGMTLEDYINSDKMQSGISTLNESFEAQGGSLNVSAEGNTMVLTVTFHDLGDADLTQLGELLAASLEGLSSSYEPLAADLKDAIGADDASIKVVCAAEDGTELCSKEFFPAE